MPSSRQPWDGEHLEDNYLADSRGLPALYSALPEYRDTAAEFVGRAGMVTVWDDAGRYVGCMGVNLWRHLLSVSGGPVDAAPSWDDLTAWRSAPNGTASA